MQSHLCDVARISEALILWMVRLVHWVLLDTVKNALKEDRPLDDLGRLRPKYLHAVEHTHVNVLTYVGPIELQSRLLSW